MQVIKKMIFSMLLLSTSSMHCNDSYSMVVMAAVSVINLLIQGGKDLFHTPTVEEKLSDAAAGAKLKYATAEQELHAIDVEESLEYARAKKNLKQCLRARQGIIERDEHGYPVGCDKEARTFVECGGREEMDLMIHNINEARTERRE